MEPVKGIYACIYKISAEEFDELMERYDKNECTECDKQLYIYQDKESHVFVAVDNSTGDMFTEEFLLESDAYIWLFGLKETEPLQEAEKHSFWW